MQSDSWYWPLGIAHADLCLLLLVALMQLKQTPQAEPDIQHQSVESSRSSHWSANQGLQTDTKQQLQRESRVQWSVT